MPLLSYVRGKVSVSKAAWKARGPGAVLSGPVKQSARCIETRQCPFSPASEGNGVRQNRHENRAGEARGSAPRADCQRPLLMSASPILLKGRTRCGYRHSNSESRLSNSPANRAWPVCAGIVCLPESCEDLEIPLLILALPVEQAVRTRARACSASRVTRPGPEAC